MGFLEGGSLVILVFIGMPLKYLLSNPIVVDIVGPIHGILFILFVLNTFRVAIEESWSFWGLTWKLLFASFVPFGTFYMDWKVLADMHLKSRQNSLQSKQ